MASPYFDMKLLKNASATKRKTARQKANDQLNLTSTSQLPRVTDLEQYSCRVCLQAGSIPIFDKHNDITLSPSLRIICCIDVNDGDGDPQFLCESCCNTLIAAVKLRDTAIKSQLVLKNLKTVKLETAPKLEEIKTENEEPKLEEKSTNDINQQTASNSFQFTKTEIKYDIEALTDTEEQEEIKEEATSLQLELDIEHHFQRTKKEAVVKCRTCNKLVKAPSAAAHIQEHSLKDEFPPKNETPTEFVCEVCGKSFRRKVFLKRHCQIHSDNLPYHCDLCPYKGRNKDYLLNHSKTHGMQNPLKCPRCPRTFLSRSNLNHHLRRYSDPTIPCTLCDKLFYENSALRKHVRIQHTGIVESHRCTTCGNIYKTRKNLLSHEIKAHKRKKNPRNQALYLKLESSESNEPTTST